MVDLTAEENIDIMIEVMSDLGLHLKASRGYKYTGTISGMRQLISSAAAEVDTKFKDGLSPWTYKRVTSLIPPYLRRGHLEFIKLGQEDEATPDPDGVPWEDGENEEEKAEAANAGDDAETEEEVLDFDPDD